MSEQFHDVPNAAADLAENPQVEADVLRKILAETRAELERVRAEFFSLQSRWASAGTAVTAEITRIQAQRDKATNTIDLMRDKFQRIVARCVEFDGLESAFTREIRAICDRARSEIEQRTDVIVQRDEWQRRAERLELALRLAADEPNIDRARQIADEALAQKEAGRE